MCTGHPLSLNLGGQLLELCQPVVMGILNCTPDSFYAASRELTVDAALRRAEQILREGGTIIDIGACSTRPGSTPVDEAEEMNRLEGVLNAVRQHWPDALLSVDTFRAEVAQRCIVEWGVQLINSVAPTAFTPALPTNVAQVVTSHAATMEQILTDLSQRVEKLQAGGQRDIIIDPGFGFGKTTEENFRVLEQLPLLSAFNLPVLVGVSRKRMLQQTVDAPAEQTLNATTAVHMAALERGANILRVHDVAQAVETVKVFAALKCEKQNR